MQASQVEVGPWGGDGGVNPWTFNPDGRIVGFLIASGVVVDSIRFTYEDKDQVSHHSDTYGGDGGTVKPLVSSHYIYYIYIYISIYICTNDIFLYYMSHI